ncbi:WD domain-containing protein [Patellaria atrata CBS 101060]|uniref:WD domain-containing protein n=1 Tax=Patellaria atrata CBS 101060 TaxID=1346257 RepID=A0A9P4S922_9PEZI|nr:WD domain-containing protein [Patellaria atrata CBS 101060]
MKISNHSAIPVYTIAGSSTARPLPEWLIRKRKRSLKHDPEFANRVELLQDFEFEEASSCVRSSEDGDWVMSTGTYKPQIHVHYLPHLSLSFARHTDTINETFILLSSDYSKSLHLQTDRFVQLHTPQGCHYSTRIPRYGRDLIYDRRSAEALIPSTGVNEDGYGEVFRLNLEVGRFMKGYEVDVGGDDYDTVGGGALQGGINTGSANTAAIAEHSHNLLAFGTSLGTVEFWDSRSRSRVGVLQLPSDASPMDSRSEVTALEFHRSGLSFAAGSSTGLIHLYDLRSPIPLLKKDQGYGYPIQNLKFLDSTSTTRAQTLEPKILSSDKRIIKIWDPRDGTPWTSVEPAVDLNHVEWCPDSGMLLTANEGRQQHAFFIPQLGPAPKWCSFLDNMVEEMAEDSNDPNAFTSSSGGEIYDNYKFLTVPQLRALNIDHLIGTTSLLRPYMHGYFVAQELYEQARLISNPDMWQEQRAKTIQEKINKERESRIRGNKKITVKVNRKLVERILERDEKNERRKAKRVLEKGGDDDAVGANRPAEGVDMVEEEGKAPSSGVFKDPRFAQLFQDEDFEIDEQSREFQAHNASTKPTTRIPRGLTAVEEEELAEHYESSTEESEDEEATRQRRRDAGRISSASYKKSGHVSQHPQMVVSSSIRKPQRNRDLSFGARAATMKGKRTTSAKNQVLSGDKEITFAPTQKQKPEFTDDTRGGRKTSRFKDRRSASGNTFRNM